MTQHTAQTTRTWHDLAADLAPDGRAVIDGERTGAADGATRPVTSPCDGRRLTELATCGTRDVDRAVRAARKAFPGWRDLGDERRKEILLTLADLMEDHARELALLETLDVGRPVAETTTMDVPGAIATIRWYAEADPLRRTRTPTVTPGRSVSIFHSNCSPMNPVTPVITIFLPASRSAIRPSSSGPSCSSPDSRPALRRARTSGVLTGAPDPAGRRRGRGRSGSGR